MILIISALQEISESISRSFTDCKRNKWKGFNEYQITVSGKSCIVGSSGTGKAITALYTQHMIEKYNPEAVMFCGLCGALDNKYEKGNMILGKDCVQHDFDVTGLGFSFGEIPGMEYKFIKADRTLLKLASQVKIDDKNIYTGRILSGDQFITNKNIAVRKDVFRQLEGNCVEMEAASAALAALINDIPFLAVTVVSDMADGKFIGNFKKFCNKSAYDILILFRQILKQL